MLQNVDERLNRDSVIRNPIFLTGGDDGDLGHNCTEIVALRLCNVLSASGGLLRYLFRLVVRREAAQTRDS